MKPDIYRLLELQRLLDSFSAIERVIDRNHRGVFRQENDTEHSYNLAMAAWYLSKWFPKLNKDLLIRYAMVHDLVEIHAGDTYIYGDKEHLDSKLEREAAALKKLEGDWDDFDDMTHHIRQYETKSDAESKFVYALDKVMPIMLIYVNDGYSWKKHKVTTKMLHDYKLPKVTLSPEILPYYEQLYALLLEHPELIKNS
jgi:putative hydrolase of HD superfamily